MRQLRNPSLIHQNSTPPHNSTKAIVKSTASLSFTRKACYSDLFNGPIISNRQRGKYISSCSKNYQCILPVNLVQLQKLKFYHKYIFTLVAGYISSLWFFVDIVAILTCLPTDNPELSTFIPSHLKQRQDQQVW